MQIASQHRDINSLLHSFFGFLKRKTDFYLVQPPEGANMGFGPGVAEHEVRICVSTILVVLTVACVWAGSARFQICSSTENTLQSEHARCYFKYKNPTGLCDDRNICRPKNC